MPETALRERDNQPANAVTREPTDREYQPAQSLSLDSSFSAIFTTGEMTIGAYNLEAYAQA